MDLVSMKILNSPYISWIVIIALAVLWRQFGPGLPTETVRTDEQIAAAFVQQRSELMVEFEARVVRVLERNASVTQHQLHQGFAYKPGPYHRTKPGWFG